MDALDSDGAILLFDGECNLCNGLVRFVIDRDPEGRIRFTSLQSDVGSSIRDRFGLSSESLDTFVLIENGRAYTRSTAALRLGRLLGLPYAFAYPVVFVPKSARDWLYEFVADRRYEWFGRRDRCDLPAPDVSERFLTD